MTVTRTGRLRAIPSRSKRVREYERELRRILDRSDILDAEAILAIRSLIEEMQARIAYRVGRELRAGDAASNWNVFWVSKLIKATNDVVEELARRTADTIDDHLVDSYKIGMELAEKPVAAATGVSILTPKITVTKLAVLAPYRAKLIKDISEVTREQISKAIRTTVALGEPADVLMQRLESQLTTKGTPFRTVAQRAEVVARTEVARAQSLANEARTREIVTEFPELTQGPNGMKQIFVVVERGEYPCKICKPFDETVWEVNDPRKPQPPLHPNCRCTLMSWFSGLSSKRRVPEPPSHRQVAVSLAASVSESCLCCH